MHCALLVPALALGAAALGINCRGSGLCANPSFHLTDLLHDAQGIDDNRVYQNGQHIACTRDLDGTGLCAFLQKTGGIRGADIKTLLQDIVNHGCTRCGSVPVFFPSDNDINHHGELTVNYVHSTGGCNGLC